VIGPPNLQTPLQNMFARSHWKLERESNLADAMERLAREHFPAVFCSSPDWKQVVDAVSRLDHPPMVIALSDDRAGSDWLLAVTSHVYVLDARRLAAPELFSLLSHAWHMSSHVGL
jgi:hypothetical protein